MATYSSVLAWRIPGMGEPGGLLSMGSHRVGHDWNNLAVAAAAYIIKYSPQLGLFTIGHHTKKLYYCWLYSSRLHIASLWLIYFVTKLYPLISLIYNSYLLFPFIYWWALRLPPYLGYYKKCCSEDRRAYIFLN